MINALLIFVSLIVIALVLFVLYRQSKMRKTEVIEEDFNSLDKVLEAVKLEMLEIVKEDYSLSMSDAEFNAMYKRKARIDTALRQCVLGVESAKLTVLELIRSFIADNVAIEKVSDLIGVSDGLEPSDHVKFEIMMYRYKKKYDKDALAEWLVNYGFDKSRLATQANRSSDKAYFVTVDDLYMAYDNERIVLTDYEKVDILAIIIYQMYKGFGILDTVREMNINGFNCGTSGSILTNITKQKNGSFKANNSVWIYYKGKYIHFRFMNFGTEDELRRIIQLLIRYNNPGPLTAKRGYLVNTMSDKSRILALRPPASEYWAVFVRKFNLDDVSPEALIIKKYTKRGDLAVKLIEFLMRGLITCGVTGRQGSGKTTLMSSIIRFIDPRYTIRILEMAPELYLRELYPTRNILSVQETSTVSAAELQDALKKSDAAVSIVGEVATDVIAARMVQMAQVASIFTIFSHHANTGKDLVYALRNSLVNASDFDMKTAEKQVTDVIKVDIHLDYTPGGKRYIERITEIIPLDENLPYPDYDESDSLNSMNKITREYYERKTDRISFYTRDILVYDIKTHTYKVANRFSPQLEAEIRKNLGEDLCIEFDKFMYNEWGRRPDLKFNEKDTIAEAMLEYLNKGLIVADSSVNVENVEDLDKVGVFISTGDDIDYSAGDVNLFDDSESNERGNDDNYCEDDDAIVAFDFFDGEVGV